MDVMSSLQYLVTGFGVATTPENLFYCLAGAVVGTLVGVLPGLGPIAGIALLIPATLNLNATSAIIMLAGIYYGAMYGGSTTSILLNVPGETASVMTCIDGYQMARPGRAGVGHLRHRLLRRGRVGHLGVGVPGAAAGRSGAGVRTPGVLLVDGVRLRCLEQRDRRLADQVAHDGRGGPHHRDDRAGSRLGQPALHVWTGV